MVSANAHHKETTDNEAGKYGVESIPNMIIFKDGKVVGQFIGITAKEDIIAAINKQLK